LVEQLAELAEPVVECRGALLQPEENKERKKERKKETVFQGCK